ncbi:MAG: hypothetical protein AMXMBFR61_04330 [Fimbriimonadales bacterium]
MIVDLISLVKELAAHPDYEPGTPVCFKTRSQGWDQPSDVADTVPYDCANGVDLWVDISHQGLVLGLEFWGKW